MKSLIITILTIILIGCGSKNASEELKNDSLNLETSNSKDLDSKQNLVAFQRDEFICIYNVEKNSTEKMVEGNDPYLSPNGKQLIFTKLEEEGGRALYLYNIETKQEHRLNVNDNNFWGAVFSPDSKYIAFSIMANNNWQIGLINSYNSNFKIIQTKSNNGLFSPTWSSNSKYIYAHNLFTIYKFDTNGNLLDTTNVQELVGDKYSFSSNSRFLFLSDNESIVFDATIDEYIKNLDEPISALFTYNIRTKEIKRLTRKGLCCNYACIDKQDNIYFSGFANMNKPWTVYKIKLSDTSLVKIIDNAGMPSVSINN